VHEKGSRDSKQKNLHVHIFFDLEDKTTGKKIHWRKDELKQLHKKYRQALEERGYQVVTNKDEEKAIHIGPEAYYNKEAKEYIENRREQARLKEQEVEMTRVDRSEEIKAMKRLDPVLLLTDLNIPYKTTTTGKIVFKAPYRKEKTASCFLKS